MSEGNDTLRKYKLKSDFTVPDGRPVGFEQVLLSEPLTVRLTNARNWTKEGGLSKTIRFNFVLSRRVKRLQRAWVALDEAPAVTVNEGTPATADVGAPNLAALVRSQFVSNEQVTLVERLLRPYANSDGIEGRRERARLDLTAALANSYDATRGTVTPELWRTSVPTAVTQAAPSTPLGVTYAKTKVDVHLAFVDFLCVRYFRIRVGDRLLTRRHKVPPHTLTRLSRANEVNMEGMPVGTLTYWTPVAVEPRPTDSTSTLSAAELGSVHIEQCESSRTYLRNALVQAGVPASLYRTSNAAFPRRLDLDMLVWMRDEDDEDDGDDEGWAFR